MDKKRSRTRLDIILDEGQIWYLVATIKGMTPFTPRWALPWLKMILSKNGLIFGDEFRCEDIADFEISGPPDCTFLNVLFHHPVERGLNRRSIPIALERVPYNEALAINIYRDHLGEFDLFWHHILFLAAHVYFTGSRHAQWFLLNRLNITGLLDPLTSETDWSKLEIKVKHFGVSDTVILDFYCDGNPYRLNDEFEPYSM